MTVREMWNSRNHSVLISYYSLPSLIAALFLLAGCSTASTQYQSRPFFLTEEDATTHGRKAWYDRIVEVDPGGAKFTVAADYQQAPPKKIAVLPFTDLGKGNFVVDKLSRFHATIRSVPAGDGATPTACAAPSRVM